MIDFIVFNLSIVVIIATGIILYKLHPIIGSERRMAGFFPLSVTVLAWVAAAIVNMFAALEFYAYTFVINVMFSIIVPYLSFRFFLSFTRSKLADSRVMKTVLIALPAADILMLLSTPYHGLYFSSLKPPVYPNTIPPAAIMFWIHIALIAAGVLFFYTILIRYIMKNYKNSPLLIITGAGAAIPFILTITYLTNLFGYDRDLSPIGFFLSISLFTYYSYKGVNSEVTERLVNNKNNDSALETDEDKTVKFTAPDARVLVVDDINTNLRVARGLLIPYKVNVDVRCSGIEAIEAVKNNKYDLILMDHKMPDMDGVETTEKIRAMGSIDKYFETVPIIAYTANADSSLIDMFLSNGFSDFMTKPIETVRLNTILEKWIPKDKQTISEEAPGVSSVTESNITIEGLDVDRGIALSGGTEKYYLETLATFIDDVQERRNEITKCLEDNNLPLYITNIHALKSASASIGADSLSEAAYALEMAAIRKDMKFISSNNNYFMMKIERIINSIINALTTYGNGGRKTNFEIDAGLFGAELLSLKTALEDLDIDGINQSIDTLLKTAQTDDVLAVVRNISKCILMVEYDEAETLILSLLGKLQR